MYKNTKLPWRMVLNAVAGESDEVKRLYKEYERAVRLHVTVQEILEAKSKKKCEGGCPDHAHRLYGKAGISLARGAGPGPRNQLVQLDSGELVVAPWGNWRKEK